jgi:signal transduction histidine kinase
MKSRFRWLTLQGFIGYRFILWGEIRFLLIVVLCLQLQVSGFTQEKQTIQIKTFDQKLQVLRNVEVSLNNGGFVSVGNRGVAIVELNTDELPIKTVTIKDDKLEAASWNFSKGIIEIIVRQKSYSIIHFSARFPNGTPASQSSITFKGSKTITVNTNQAGEFDLPLSLSEKVNSPEQFHIQGLQVLTMTLSEKENVIIVDRPKLAEPQKSSSIRDELSDFDLSKLDSINSLTVFYAVFKNISIKSLNEDARIRIDAKFNQLVAAMEDSVARSQTNFMGNISDSSFVTEDLKSLLNYATIESEALLTNRADFENKINFISAKLEKGVSNLSEDERTNLLSDLDLLEQLLIQNESKFYQNQNDYRDIINTLKEKYFDIQNLETKLSVSEMEREEEQRVFRNRLIIALIILILFAGLIILLISFSGRLRKQAKELKSVNEEIKTINENLEDIVIKRTQLLEESNKELDTFLYRSSHDLRAPIRSILGLCNITDHIPASELVERLRSTTMGMDRMLKRLITISEISQESGNLSAIALAQQINDVKEKHEYLIRSSGVEFHVDCPKELTIHSSAFLLESILTNLIENAVFFSSLKNREHARVEVKATKIGNDTELQIYDNGVGIEESIRPKLFHMFFTGHEKSKGNGLGLYTVHKCVQALGGKIFVASEADRYTRFRIVLPDNHE